MLDVTGKRKKEDIFIELSIEMEVIPFSLVSRTCPLAANLCTHSRCEHPDAEQRRGPVYPESSLECR